MRQLYANKMFQNETIILRIKCFKMRQLYIKCFKTIIKMFQMNTNKMFQNETIIYKMRIKCFKTKQLYTKTIICE